MTCYQSIARCELQGHNEDEYRFEKERTTRGRKGEWRGSSSTTSEIFGDETISTRSLLIGDSPRIAISLKISRDWK